jgi:D-proline reductase (dithiol) PrdB
VTSGALGMCHLHVNPADVLADHNIALPTDRLAEVVAEGTVGAVAPEHVSVMGYQERPLDGWRGTTLPEVVDMLRGEAADGVVLAPV